MAQAGTEIISIQSIMGMSIGQSRVRGFTFIELLIAVAIVTILAAIALPAYTQYVKKSRARSASADLVAMSLDLENRFQKQLQYPAALSTANTAQTQAALTGWRPSQGNIFTYTVTSTTGAYTVTAAGIGNMNCTLRLVSPNVRTATGADCGFVAW